MKNIAQVFQYMAIQRCPVLYRLLKKALCQECTIVLDLEDTLRDIDKTKTKSLKAWGRLELSLFARTYPDFFKNKAVGIRVNDLKSFEFELDLEILAEISQIWDLECIIGPKIDSAENIQGYLSYLKNKGVRYKTFIPIIETIQGMNNLSSIVRHRSVAQAFYGHNDYSLDLGQWPFFEQDEIEFWDIASPFIQKVEGLGVQYVHPPISYFSNKDFFSQVLLCLQSRCHHPFSVSSINSAQTALIHQLQDDPSHIRAKELRSFSCSLQNKIESALYVRKICSTKKRNFGVDPMTGRFFSPHMYVAALQFLGQLDG